MSTWMGWFRSNPLRVRSRAGKGSRVRYGLHFERLETRQLLHGAADFGLAAAAGESAPRPDFSLQDMNAASPTYQQALSPRDYLEQVSGWYFAQGM